MKDKLDILLSTKSEIETPHGLEEKILRRVQNEKARGSNRGFGILFNRYSYAFASVASLLIVVSVMLNINTNNKLEKAENELFTLGAEIEYYKTGNSIISQVEKEDKLKNDMEEIQEMDDYINMLSS